MKRMRWFWGAALLLICAPALVLALPVQWPEADGGNDNWYFVVAGDLTWLEADEFAGTLTWLGLQGHLGTITSQEEQDWLYQKIYVDYGLNGVVNIGGYQLQGSAEPDGGWTWVTDEEWGFTNWGADQPDNDPDTSGYLTMVGDGEVWLGEWDDHDGEVVQYHLIEFEDSVIATESISLSAVKALYR